MNQTILKIAGVVMFILGLVAMFLTGVGESTAIAIVSAVFVLAGLILALFKPRGSSAPSFGSSWIEIMAVDTRTRKSEFIGTVDNIKLESLKKTLKS